MTHFALSSPPQTDTLGQHILMDFYGCDDQILNDVQRIEASMNHAAYQSGATIVNTVFHRFSPFGASGVVVIQESHFAIHTWPEYQYAAVDLFTCGSSIEWDIAYQILEQSLKPQYVAKSQINRGNLCNRNAAHPDLKSGWEPQLENARTQEQHWFTEKDDNTAISFRYKGQQIFQEQSQFQNIEIFDTLKYGRMLVLDQKVMCAEQDEQAYHEMLVHVPMFTLTEIKNVLVIGGGDGGTVRELLKHETLESVTMVEIDEAVIKAARQYLPTLSQALAHPKLNLIIGDAVEFVAQHRHHTYDLILIDSSDPVGPAEGLVSANFYQQVYDCLSEIGILVTQSGSPRYDDRAFQHAFRTLQKGFGAAHVHCYLVFIPTYPSGMWSFSYASKAGLHPIDDFDRQRAGRFIQAHPLDYYNPAMHTAAFSLPNFVSRLLS